MPVFRHCLHAGEHGQAQDANGILIPKLTLEKALMNTLTE